MESLRLMDAGFINENRENTTRAINYDNEQTTDRPEITTLVNKLKKDNVINSSDNSVSVKDDRLYINGIKQGSDLNNKYKDIFKGKGNFTYGLKDTKR
jgi:hypothetical protein